MCFSVGMFYYHLGWKFFFDLACKRLNFWRVPEYPVPHTLGLLQDKFHLKRNILVTRHQAKQRQIWKTLNICGCWLMVTKYTLWSLFQWPEPANCHDTTGWRMYMFTLPSFLRCWSPSTEMFWRARIYQSDSYGLYCFVRFWVAFRFDGKLCGPCAILYPDWCPDLGAIYSPMWDPPW